MKNEKLSELRQRIQALLESSRPADEKLLQLCLLIHTELPDMDWVGFYFMDDEKNALVLGPFVGEPTDHTVIPYGRGICGQVAISGRTLNVPDVSQADNYLACSLKTKSEIVIPIYNEAGKLIGQLDIDSHVLHRFDSATSEFLEEVCTAVGKKIFND
ncbi:MAG: GAF domain-containing protein [Thermaurantimonas sp.]